MSSSYNSEADAHERLEPYDPEKDKEDLATPFLPKLDPVAQHRKEMEKRANQRKNFIHPAVLIVFIDLLIPLMLILSAISCMSIIGMLFIILLYLHVVISNIAHSFRPTRIFLIIDLIFNLVVFVFAIIDFAIDLDAEWVRILGLDFNNIIASSPTFTLITSLIAMICQIISLVLLNKTDYTSFMLLRRKMYGTLTIQLIFDLIWAVSNAFNAASNFCYLYLPILLFFILTNILQSCMGRNPLRIFTKIIMYYSTLFALFELYLVSYIGEKWNPGRTLRYIYIADDSTKGVNVFLTVLFAYISVENLSAPGLDPCKGRPIPLPLKNFSDFFLIVAFICTFIFAMFYPNYLSILWMLIPSIASFADLRTLKRLLFPMLTIVFTITFVAQALTTFYIADPPDEDGVEYKNAFLKLFGLFRYPEDFTFSACGFYIICLLGQVGKLSLGRTAFKKPKMRVEEEEEEDNEFEDLPDIEVGHKIKKKKHRSVLKNKGKGWKKFVHGCKLIGIFFYSVFSYLALATLVILAITVGFYRNRFAFMILCVIFIIIVCLALYYRPVFEFIKFVSACICMIAAFYKTCLNEECANQLDKCLFFGQFGGPIQDMVDTGLIAPTDMSLAKFIWPMAVILALSTYLTKNDKALRMQLPPFIASAIFIIVAILHIVYMFVYDTSIFSLLFLIVGILMFICQYLGSYQGLAFSCCMSCIVVSFQLCCFLLSHFDNVRNMVTSLIKHKSIIDISHIYGPSVEVALLAGILFLSTIAFNTKPPKEMNYFIRDILFEARARLDELYFFLCWIFIFLFSIANHKATFIKFLLMVFFSLGDLTRNFFYKIRVAFLIFNVLYLCVQFVFHIFALYGESYADTLSYIGFYFYEPAEPTKSQRNLPVAWQLIVAFFGIVNIRELIGKTPDPRYESFFTTRLYNAICACLHHWLPIIIQISLCISTLFNPSFFGIFSYVVMILVNYKPKVMNKRGAMAICIIFNICFIVQYLLFLGLPKFFHKDFNAVTEIEKKWHYGPEGMDNVRKWFRWTGTYDVRMSALSTNCVSSFIFTLYIVFKDKFVDYNAGFNNLPYILKHFVIWFTTFVFEIMFALILIVCSQIKTIDGLCFFTLGACLFIVSLLAKYPKKKALDIMSLTTIIIIGLRLFSRLPVFTDDGIGIWIRRAFDLPFQGSSEFENLLIIVYALERLCLHIMGANIYNECSDYHMKRIAYRFIRSRQLNILERLDQEILQEKHKLEINQIRSMTSANVEQMMDSLRANDNLIIGRAELMSTTTMLVQKNHKWYSAFYRFYKACCYKVIRLLAGSLHLNSDAGMNVLTLETLTILMKKALRCYEGGTEYIPERKEKDFFLSLPPSVPLHLQSIADMICYQTINKKKRSQLMLRYVTEFIRRISLPLLTLMVLIYVYIKPYFFSMIIVLMFCCLILPLDIKGFPVIYIIFFSIVEFVYFLRNLCTINILKGYIIDASNTVTVTKMSISVIKMFGIDPEEISTVEIFLFLFTVFFIVDQLQWCEIYPPDYYYKLLLECLPGFPDEYCYGIINKPEETLDMQPKAKYEAKAAEQAILQAQALNQVNAQNTQGGAPLTGNPNEPRDSLGMDVEKPPTFIEQFKYTMRRAGLIETQHSMVMMILDVISFFLILVLWGMWTHGTEATSPIEGGTKYVFRIDVLFIFMLLIQTIFSLTCYAFSLSSNHIGLYVVNAIWFLYTYCISFYYIASENREVPASLQFYFFVRFFWHLVAAHKCFRGRRIVAFKYPNFVKDWRLIFSMNKFIRICPFVFEIQTILIWMSQKTKVYLLDFFVIRDVAMQLEDLICLQSNPNQESQSKKGQNRFLKGGLLLLLFAIIIFVPMFFMASSSASKESNRPTNVQLEIGFPSFAPFFSCQGTVSSGSTGDQRQISDSRIDSLQFLVIASTSTLYLADFPTMSFEAWNPSIELTNFMIDALRTNTYMQPYCKISLYFEYPTSVSNVQNIIYQKQLPPISEEDRLNLIEILRGNTTSRLNNLPIPMTVFVPADDKVYSADDLTRDVSMELTTSGTQNIWDILLTSDSIPISFLRSLNSFRVLVYSEEVSKDLDNSFISTDPSIIGIYLLLIITIGMVIRAFSFNLLNQLWIDRMDRPQKLYRMIVANNAFRAAKDVDKEKLMSDQLLDTLRSQEACLRITANDAVD